MGDHNAAGEGNSSAATIGHGGTLPLPMDAATIASVGEVTAAAAAGGPMAVDLEAEAEDVEGRVLTEVFAT